MSTKDAELSVQYRTESLVHELLKLPEVLQVKEEIRERLFRPRVLSNTARECLDDAVDETTVAALLAVAGGDPALPRLTWYECPPHVSFGREIAGGRYGFDNPDRSFRYFFVDPEWRYEIRGRRAPGDGAPFYILIESCWEGPPGWCFPLAFLHMESIDFEADGSFRITVDSAPTDGRRNHLHLPPGSAHVLIRETLLKWDVQMPTTLSVIRVSGPEVAPLSFDAMAQRAPAMILAQAELGLMWYDHALAEVPKNTLATPQIRPAPPGELPWGMTATGRFSVADDEAFVFTIDREQAGYLGIQLADPWMRSIDYANHTSCLHHDEVWHNPDGTVTYVVAARDPEVANWLDTNGTTDGVMLLRWELLQSTPDPTQTVRDSRLVKLVDVASVLPSAMPATTPDDRELQVAVRRRGIEKRQSVLLSAGTPSDRDTSVGTSG